MDNLLIYSIGILIFIFTIIISVVINKNKYNDKYSLLNHFPFEIAHDNNIKIINSIMLFVSIILIVANTFCFIIFPTNHINYFLSNVIGTLFIIVYVLFYSLFYIRFEKSYLLHNIVSSFFGSISLILDAFGILYIFRSDSFDKLYIIIYLLLLVLKFVTIVLLLIKGLSASEKIINENEIQYKRKRIIVYSVYEWINILLLIITNLTFFIILK